MWSVKSSFIQSYEDVLQHGKTLYFWKDSLKEEELRDGTEGPAARELYYSSSRGISSNEEAFEALKTDKGSGLIFFLFSEGVCKIFVFSSLVRV